MAPPQENIDVLFDVKNLFYIGNYQQTINEAQKLKIPPGDDVAKSERDVYLYRAYIAEKKYRVILDEISEASSADVKPLKILADYLAHRGRRESIINMLDEQTSRSANIPNHTFVIAAATIYVHEKNYESALKVLHNDDHIESMAMNIEIYLKMDRVDVARKELKSMQEKDEDNTLTQLAQAWINIAMMSDEACSLFNDTGDKKTVKKSAAKKVAPKKKPKPKTKKKSKRNKCSDEVCCCYSSSDSCSCSDCMSDSSCDCKECKRDKAKKSKKKNKK